MFKFLRELIYPSKNVDIESKVEKEIDIFSCNPSSEKLEKQKEVDEQNTRLLKVIEENNKEFAQFIDNIGTYKIPIYIKEYENGKFLYIDNKLIINAFVKNWTYIVENYEIPIKFIIGINPLVVPKPMKKSKLRPSFLLENDEVFFSGRNFDFSHGNPYKKSGKKYSILGGSIESIPMAVIEITLVSGLKYKVYCEWPVLDQTLDHLNKLWRGEEVS